MDHTHMSLHVIVLLYPHGAQERGCTACVRSVLLSGWSGCRAVSAAVRPLCAVGLSGSCQAVTLGPDSDGTPLMSGSAVRLSDTCCQAVRESAVNAVRLSGTVRRCPGFAVRLSDQGSGDRPAYQGHALAGGDEAPPLAQPPLLVYFNKHYNSIRDRCNQALGRLPRPGQACRLWDGQQLQPWVLPSVRPPAR